MVPLASALLGALGTFAAVSRADRLRPQMHVRPATGCTMAIVLVGVDGSRVSKTIDDLTGGLGFSHAYFDPCQVDAGGEPMAIGYTVADGVHWAPRSSYKSDRRQVRIELPPMLGAEVYGCVRQRVSKPLNVPALVAGVDSAGTCVGLIVGCLPWAMQERLRRYQVGPCISPNTIAAFFGVDDETVRITMITPDFAGV